MSGVVFFVSVSGAGTAGVGCAAWVVVCGTQNRVESAGNGRNMQSDGC